MSNKLVIPLMAILSVIAPSAADDIFVIESPTVTNWGEWGEWEYCPKATFAQAAQLKYDSWVFSDRSGANAIRLYCGDPQDPDTPTITSAVGPFGSWLNLTMTCPNQLNGFELQVAATRGDRVGTTNVRFQCIAREQSSPRKIWYHRKEQEEPDFLGGTWTGMQTCGPDYSICGIQTQTQPWRGDNTGLNNVRVACCELDPIPI